jgi:hypothetical protein
MDVLVTSERADERRGDGLRVHARLQSVSEGDESPVGNDAGDCTGVASGARLARWTTNVIRHGRGGKQGRGRQETRTSKTVSEGVRSGDEIFDGGSVVNWRAEKKRENVQQSQEEKKKTGKKG